MLDTAACWRSLRFVAAAVLLPTLCNLSGMRLQEGTIDIVTLLNTQQTLFQALDLLAQVRLTRFQAVVSLFQALGGGWPAPPLAPGGRGNTVRAAG